MKRSERLSVERLLRHCRMFLYASAGSPDCLVNPVAENFFQFGLLHLTSTMFITTDKKTDPAAGVFHRILDPMGHGTLLAGVDAALATKVGQTTLRQFIRTKRNKLATHRDLSFLSQSKEARNVAYNKIALKQYEAAMHLLETAVLALSRELERMTEAKNRARAIGPSA